VFAPFHLHPASTTSTLQDGNADLSDLSAQFVFFPSKNASLKISYAAHHTPLQSMWKESKFNANYTSTRAASCVPFTTGVTTCTQTPCTNGTRLAAEEIRTYSRTRVLAKLVRAPHPYAMVIKLPQATYYDSNNSILIYIVQQYRLLRELFAYYNATPKVSEA
jgi:hypothetical protein